MSQKLNKLTLPSGQKVTFRTPTALDTYRFQGCLPDAAADGEPEKGMTQGEVMRLGIRMICVLSHKPKYWADLEDENTLPPAGCEELDLSNVDFAAYMEAIAKVQTDEADVARPLAETGAAS